MRMPAFVSLHCIPFVNIKPYHFSVLQRLHSVNVRHKRQLDAGKQKKDKDSSDQQTTYESEEFHLTVLNVLSLNAAYWAVGAVLFSLWEEWSLFESFYYCFVTLTTVGKQIKFQAKKALSSSTLATLTFSPFICYRPILHYLPMFPSLPFVSRPTHIVKPDKT